MGKKMTDDLNPYLTQSNWNQTSDSRASEPLSLLSRADVNKQVQRTALAVADVERGGFG
jgi:hypothetical protein